MACRTTSRFFSPRLCYLIAAAALLALQTSAHAAWETEKRRHGYLTCPAGEFVSAIHPTKRTIRCAPGRRFDLIDEVPSEQVWPRRSLVQCKDRQAAFTGFFHDEDEGIGRALCAPLAILQRQTYNLQHMDVPWLCLNGWVVVGFDRANRQLHCAYLNPNAPQPAMRRPRYVEWWNKRRTMLACQSGHYAAGYRHKVSISSYRDEPGLYCDERYTSKLVMIEGVQAERRNGVPLACKRGAAVSGVKHDRLLCMAARIAEETLVAGRDPSAVQCPDGWLMTGIDLQRNVALCGRMLAPSQMAATTTPKTQERKPASAGSGQTLVYLGCFADRGQMGGTQGRDLSGSALRSGTMTIQSCLKHCAQQGYAVAGLQHAMWCFCGNSFGRFGASNACNMRCNGNTNQTCGGAWANSIYKVRP